MKKLLPIFFLLSCICSFSENNGLEIFDISQKQIRLLKIGKDFDIKERNKLFADSIYTPYKKFWDGYMGGEEKIVGWMNRALDNLPAIIERDNSINGEQLFANLISVRNNLTRMTGYEAKGKWYVVYGPGWTDLGSLGNYAMFIDLSHENNNTNEDILKMFPHELTHQIMGNVNTNKDQTAMSTIIGEGFAVYMNQHYWKGKYRLDENLGFSKEELLSCLKNNSIILAYFNENKFSEDTKKIDSFRNRSIKIQESLPAAIGYYIGYRIIESYVKKHGKNSWKDVFTKSPRTIYESSGFAK